MDRPDLTPLMNAAANNDLSRVQVLLAQGADAKQKAAKGETALFEAIERRDLPKDNLPVVDALLKAGADPNEQEIYRESALLISMTRDNVNPSVTLRLLEAGAVVPHDCGDGDSLMSLATQESSVEVMKALADRGAPVNCSYRGATPLYWAATNAETEKVSLLLQYGADAGTQVNGNIYIKAASCLGCEPRVQANFAKTRQLLEDHLRSAPTRK